MRLALPCLPTGGFENRCRLLFRSIDNRAGLGLGFPVPAPGAEKFMQRLKIVVRWLCCLWFVHVQFVPSSISFLADVSSVETVYGFRDFAGRASARPSAGPPTRAWRRANPGGPSAS